MNIYDFLAAVLERTGCRQASVAVSKSNKANELELVLWAGNTCIVGSFYRSDLEGNVEDMLSVIGWQVSETLSARELS